MKSALILTAALFLMGCDDTLKEAPKAQPSGPYWVTVQGTIFWTAHDTQGHTNVVIETEQGQSFTVVLLDYSPPAWAGLHGVFAYESADKDSGLWKNFIVKQRLSENLTNAQREARK